MNSKRIPLKMRCDVLICGPTSKIIDLTFLNRQPCICFSRNIWDLVLITYCWYNCPTSRGERFLFNSVLLWFISSFAILIITFYSPSMTLFKYMLFFLFWVKYCFVETILYSYADIISLIPLALSFFGIHNLSMALFLWKLLVIERIFLVFLSIPLITSIVQPSSPKVGINTGTANALWDMSLLFPEGSLGQTLRTLLKYSVTTLFLLYHQRKYFHLSQGICTIHLL